MRDKSKKASMHQIKRLIQPHIEKHIFGKDAIYQEQIKAMAQKILPFYSNVEISAGCFEGNGKPMIKITVQGLLHSETIILEIKDSNM